MVLASVVAEKGQRALVGKLSVLLNQPTYNCQSDPQQSLIQAEEFIVYVNELKVKVKLHSAHSSQPLPIYVG